VSAVGLPDMPLPAGLVLLHIDDGAVLAIDQYLPQLGESVEHHQPRLLRVIGYRSDPEGDSVAPSIDNLFDLGVVVLEYVELNRYVLGFGSNQPGRVLDEKRNVTQTRKRRLQRNKCCHRLHLITPVEALVPGATLARPSGPRGGIPIPAIDLSTSQLLQIRFGVVARATTQPVCGIKAD
jgi:hypothetical protein